jgi:oxygen-independent coproporphyrinogen III oxidase
MAMTEAMIAEIGLRKGYLETDLLNSIYFGGGTPSLLSHAELNAFFKAIRSHFRIDPLAEVTFEVNPDDVNPENLAA